MERLKICVSKVIATGPISFRLTVDRPSGPRVFEGFLSLMQFSTSSGKNPAIFVYFWQLTKLMFIFEKTIHIFVPIHFCC